MPLRILQRPGSGVGKWGPSMAAFGSHADIDNFHGWLICYGRVGPAAAGLDGFSATLAETLSGDPSGRAGPRSGDRLRGNIIMVTGNGSFNGITDFWRFFCSQACRGRNLSLLDWFTAGQLVRAV